MKILTIILSMICGPLLAQNIAIENIAWTVDNLYDSASHAQMPFQSVFKTYPGESKIDWLQDNGSNLTTFYINSMATTWNDLTAQGEAEFQVTYLGKTGFVRIERDVESLKIKLFIMEGPKNLMPFVFHIANYSKL